MCDGGWEWWAGGRLMRECDIISRVIYATRCCPSVQEKRPCWPYHVSALSPLAAGWIGFFYKCDQWRRSLVNCGGQGQSGQAIKLFQIAPYINDFQTLNIQQSRFPTACRRLKNSFAFHFWHKSFVLDDVKLAELSNNSFQWNNVTF